MKEHKKSTLLFLGKITEGGMATYWRRVIDHGENMKWYVMQFSDEKNRVNFGGKNKKNIEYISYARRVSVVLRFVSQVARIKPDKILVSCGINEVFIFPFLFFIRLLFPRIIIKGIYLNGNLCHNKIKEKIFWIAISCMALTHSRNVFVSESTRKYWYLIRGKAIPMPVYIGKRNTVVHNTIHIGFLGRHSWEKGPDLFMDTVAAIENEYYQPKYFLKYIIASNGPMTDVLKKHPAAGVVSFIGWIKSIEEFLGTIDILLITSRFEGYPISCLEALEKAVPVIGFDVGGVKEIIAPENKKWLVPVGDIEALSEKVILFIQDYSENYLHYFNNQMKSDKSFALSDKTMQEKKWAHSVSR